MRWWVVIYLLCWEIDTGLNFSADAYLPIPEKSSLPWIDIIDNNKRITING